MAVVENNIQLRGKDSSDNDVLMYPITKAENVVGVMPIKNGGTGASTAEEALTNLGITATADEINKLAGSIPRASKDLRVTAPAGGSTVTATNGDETYSVVADSDGIATFEDLTTGTWSVTVTNGTQTVTRTVAIEPDYSTTVHFFEAYIDTFYPVGWTCTCSNGDTTLTAPDTSGHYIFAVHNSGDWVLTYTFNTYTITKTKTVSTNGEIYEYDVSIRTKIIQDGNVKKSMGAMSVKMGDGIHTTTCSPTYSTSGGILTIYAGNTNSVTGGVGCLAMLNGLDCSIYKQIRLVVTEISSTDKGYPRLLAMGFKTDNNVSVVENMTLAQKVITDVGEHILDISNLSPNMAYAAILLPSSGYNSYIKVSDFIVEDRLISR